MKLIKPEKTGERGICHFERRGLIRSEYAVAFSKGRLNPCKTAFVKMPADEERTRRLQNDKCLSPLFFLVLLLSTLIFPLSIAHASTLNPFDPNFKLSYCNGPEQGAHINPITKAYNENYNNPDYTPCDFSGLVGQVQLLINAMIVLGVVASIITLTYAGGLYITGVEKNITKARNMFQKTGIGFILMLSAWFIVWQILQWLANNASGVSTLIGKP